MTTIPDRHGYIEGLAVSPGNILHSGPCGTWVTHADGTETEVDTPQMRSLHLEIMRESSGCPQARDVDAFGEYQARVLEPLRQRYRAIMDAAIDDAMGRGSR